MLCQVFYFGSEFVQTLVWKAKFAMLTRSGLASLIAKHDTAGARQPLHCKQYHVVKHGVRNGVPNHCKTKVLQYRS